MLSPKELKLKDIEDIKKKLTQNEKRCPEQPDDDDCCGEGCVPCVFDLYYDRMDKYEEKKMELQSTLLDYEEDLSEL